MKLVPTVVVPNANEWLAPTEYVRMRLPADLVLEIIGLTKGAKTALAMAKDINQPRRTGAPTVRAIDRENFRRDLHMAYEVERLCKNGVGRTDAYAHVGDAFGIEETVVRKAVTSPMSEHSPAHTFSVEAKQNLDWYIANLNTLGKVKAKK